MSQKSKFGNRLALTTALAGVLFAGYGGRSAYAGTCVGAAGTYTCSGAANSAVDTTEVISFVGLGAVTVTTSSGFGIDTSVNGGAALELSAYGDGSLTFTDANAATITADETGIYAFNDAGLALSISTSGIVTSNNAIGISGYNTKYSTDLTVTAQAAVTGGTNGIATFNYGSGVTTITTTAAVTGTNTAGISSISIDGASTTIAAMEPVTGGQVGVGALSFGSGPVSITTTGIVVGTDYAGIYASTYPSGLTIDAQANVSSEVTGIFARSYDSLSITTAGVVQGDTGYGVYSYTGIGNLASITLNSPTIVSAPTSGRAISNNYSDSAITVNTGASVLGSIILGDGSDDLTFAGGDFSGVTTFDGGDDADVADGFIDTLTFAGSSGMLIAADVINWESIVVEAGSTVTFDGIENLITPSLSNAGEVNTQDGAVGDSLTLSGDFSGGGTLSLDTVADDGSGGSDIFIIQGDASGTTTINIANTGGAGGQTTGDGILVVQVDGTSPADGFSMAPFIVGEFEYSLVQVGSNWYLQSQNQNPALPAIAIPTIGQWSMGLLILLLGGLAGRQLTRRRAV